MKSSKLTTKYQATIPEEIRDKLHLKAGDSVTFRVLENGLVVVQKTRPLDKEYLKALNEIMSEWESEYDEDTFKHLQNL